MRINIETLEFYEVANAKILSQYFHNFDILQSVILLKLMMIMMMMMMKRMIKMRKLIMIINTIIGIIDLLFPNLQNAKLKCADFCPVPKRKTFIFCPCDT